MLTFDARIDTVSAGRLVTSRRTVYPRAGTVDDHVQLVFLADGWTAYDTEYGDVFQPRSRLRIVNRRGKVVWADVQVNTGTPVFDWDARRSDGTALPEGAYRARLRTVDAAGNVQRAKVRLQVSHRPARRGGVDQHHHRLGRGGVQHLRRRLPRL